MLVALATLAAVHAPAHDPTPDRPLAALLTDSDYPAMASRRGVETGIVGVRLDVGSDGTPTGCTVTLSADVDIDRRTCDILMVRAHFRPARDRRGRAIAGSVSTRIHWAMPLSVSIPGAFTAMRVVNMLRLDAQGNITCLTRYNDGPPSTDAAERCNFLARSGAVEAMRALAAPADLLLVYSLVPQCADPIPEYEEVGVPLIIEETAHLVFAPDGSVADCQPAAVHASQVPFSMRLQQACWMRNIEHYFNPAPNQEVRHAETAIRVYFRRR